MDLVLTELQDPRQAAAKPRYLMWAAEHPKPSVDTPAPGHYWKTPFIWEPGCPEPPAQSGLHFEPVDGDWLRHAIGAVMSSSLDESDQFTVDKLGLENAVAEVLELAPRYFSQEPGWWRAAIDSTGQRVGFVLPTTFTDPSRWKDGRRQGTILYMGVLPGCRGKGHALELVREATRIFNQAHCWRIFCDTGTGNHPMVNSFRKAGYLERTPWQRPLA